MTDKPDLTVAIDLGTTFTGVGFLFPNGTIYILNNWPGSNSGNEVKVPNRLVYNHDNTISSWGFSCALQDDPLPLGKREHRHFRMFFDPETSSMARCMGLTATCSNKQAEKCTTDFLREIHDHIERTYGELNGADWSNETVAFLFSVPTTWRGLAAINTLRNAIRSSGFGTRGHHHTVQFDLTEAEAAVADTFKSDSAQCEEGDIFLTIDVGESTTDLSLVQVTNFGDGIREISQITEVSGIGTGSLLIDYAFGNLIEERLAGSPDVPFEISNGLARKMMNSKQFQIVKDLFGDPAAIATVHRILIPGVSNTFNHDKLHIARGAMIIDKYNFLQLSH
ncbi:hypothetical protein NW752_003250 [Fusarium irregulare]|uniref:Hsp70 protein n=1 Tax=Fusarium irregulare TaxID=2494466 RepID=A0A9W8UGP5_9HYPO|nr:hypothetical protein NW766_000938 [Fusarium irregulare]KAJ4025774.1 hypothetical protein NW752_003250 [Fusarium irregulare]